MSNNPVIWNGYAVFGDIKELDRIAESEGFIHMSKEDLISVLSPEGNNYVTTGVNDNLGEAFSEAIAALPCKIDKVNNLAIDFCSGTKEPAMAQLSAIAVTLSEANPHGKIIWGASTDVTLGDSYKVTLLASVKA